MEQAAAGPRKSRTGAPGDGLDASWRWATLALLGLFAVLPFAQAGRALAAGWQPTGDVALIGLRAKDVPVDPPGLGQPDSADASGSSGTSAHLGPIESYLLFVPMAVLGVAPGMVFGVAAINAAAMVSGLWFASRRGGPILVGLLAAGLPVMTWSIGVAVLHGPLNSLVPTLAMIPLVLTAWSLWEGDWVAAPWFAFWAAFVLQPHLAFAPFAGPAVLAGIVGAVTTGRRRGVDGTGRGYLIGAGALAALAWLPPLLVELSSRPSNMTAVARSITAERATMGLPFGLQRLATVTAPAPRPFFATRQGLFLEIGLPSAVTVVVGLLLVGAAVSLGLHLRWRRRARGSRFLLLVVACLGMATWASARLPPAGVVRSDHARWMWTGGLLFWSAVLWCLWTLVPRTRREHVARPVVAGLLAVAVAGAFVVAAAPPLRGDPDVELMPRLRDFNAAIIDRLPEGQYVVEAGDGLSLLGIGPAVVLALDDAGYRVFVDESDVTRGFDRRHFYDGRAVAGRVRIYSGPTTDLPAGARLLVRQGPRPGAVGEDRAVLSAYLVPA